MLAGGTITLFLHIFFFSLLSSRSLFDCYSFSLLVLASATSPSLYILPPFLPSSLHFPLLPFSFPFSFGLYIPLLYSSSLSLSPHLSVTFPAYAISAPTFLGAYIDHHVGNLDKRGRESKEEELHEAGKRGRKEEWKEGRKAEKKREDRMTNAWIER